MEALGLLWGFWIDNDPPVGGVRDSILRSMTGESRAGLEATVVALIWVPTPSPASRAGGGTGPKTGLEAESVEPKR